MADLQVICINKPVHDDRHEAITHLGGYGWHWTRQQVVQMINNGTNTFYTMVGGKRANVGVVNGSHGAYVRTYADNVWTDNLLALDECAFR
ncbi:MAG: DUF3892 domain-containing protein [Proteobacteria bacterium]|nr:DUF3892 domain-containing protein [Pseudomonadota bacterium]